MTKGLWLKKSVKKYFGIPVQVSDPLLNVAKWIAYVTEIGATVMVATPLLLYFVVVITYKSVIFRALEAFLVFTLICLAVGLMAICYLHFMWVKPSRHLLLGLQQLSAIKFLPWILTAFLHSVPIAWLYFTHMTITYAYNNNMYKMPKRRLRTDLTYW